MVLNFPSIPFPPMIIHTDSDPLVIVGVNGELCRVDKKTLEILEEHAKPFPSEITNSTICNQLFVGSWVESELQQARMAALSIDSGFVNGIDKSELRFSENDSSIDCSVAGSEWSHVLDAEPLGIAAENDLICFTNYKRGIYCIDSNSNEVWRRDPLYWPNNDEIPHSDVIHTIAIGPHPHREKMKCIWVWSMTNCWATLDWSDGSIISQGAITTKGELDLVKCGGEGEWIIGLSSGEIIRLSGEELAEEAISGGPCHDAFFLNGAWHIAGWREDILWSDDSVQRTARKELGVALYQHPVYGVVVLDNQGNWSSFASSTE